MKREKINSEELIILFSPTCITALTNYCCQNMKRMILLLAIMSEQVKLWRILIPKYTCSPELMLAASISLSNLVKGRPFEKAPLSVLMI